MPTSGKAGARSGAAGGAEGAVFRAVESLPPGPWLLAVSGGRDSMVLMDACDARRRGDIAAVATYDHGTGPAATRAAMHVEAEALRRSLPVVAGRSSRPVEAVGEAAWRSARWAFLDGWAADLRSRVVTAHTRDDQAETIFMRLLRGAGPRGMAAMRAPTPVLRPFLGLDRATIALYAAARRVKWVEDPSNQRLVHFRNRVRLELLPAFEEARPGFTDWLVSLGERAAEVRDGIARAVDALSGVADAGSGGKAVAVASTALEGYGEAELELLWPEIAARARVALDRRGLKRLVAEAARLRVGAAIPLAGGASVSRTVSTLVVRAGE
ncbi:MAG: tRNA lysidine(34) synthetase TilS [Gemmatimonadaceae bacterium]|nr:tRNA lysidine(34) synthetase TilS [Gemmatimonadaceae bacterium]